MGKDIPNLDSDERYDPPHAQTDALIAPATAIVQRGQASLLEPAIWVFRHAE